MSLIPYIKGLATWVYRPHHMHEQLPARYFYSVWMRHLVNASEHGYQHKNTVVAEIGPGSSLGTGLAALLSGAKSYYAFDIVAAADREHNLKVFDELIELFHARAPIPDASEFPNIYPRLKSYGFPEKFVDTAALNGERIAHIKALLSSGKLDSDNGLISYMVPWHLTKSHIGKVDLILSQAVLEHVSDLKQTYQAISDFLNPGGFSSHNIDFRSHGITPEWNGQWRYADWQWRIVSGNRSYFINREPLSQHMQLAAENGLMPVTVDANTDFSKLFCGSIDRQSLAPRFQNLSEEDFTTSSAYLLSRKM